MSAISDKTTDQLTLLYLHSEKVNNKSPTVVDETDTKHTDENKNKTLTRKET